MVDGIVEIAEDGRYLSLYRGFLVVSENEKQLGRVPLADVSTVILSANKVSVSKNLMTALSQQNACVVFCGRSYMPESLALPYTGNYEAAQRVRCQIQSSKPLCKQIWKKLVEEKIANQARVLDWRGRASASTALTHMVRRVRSGDSGNMEAQAAKRYWATVVHSGFRRDRFAEDENVLFNYIYTVLRSATARSIVAVGLLPALGVFHRGRLNPFSLVDDLMEPYRPLADSLVLEVCNDQEETMLTPDIKRGLAKLIRLDCQTPQGVSPLSEVLHNLAYSLFKSYESGKECLRFGEMILP